MNKKPLDYGDICSFNKHDLKTLSPALDRLLYTLENQQKRMRMVSSVDWIVTDYTEGDTSPLKVDLIQEGWPEGHQCFLAWKASFKPPVWWKRAWRHVKAWKNHRTLLENGFPGMEKKKANKVVAEFSGQYVSVSELLKGNEHESPLIKDALRDVRKAANESLAKIVQDSKH